MKRNLRLCPSTPSLFPAFPIRALATILLGGLFLLAGCRSENAQDRPHRFADFYARYLEDGRQLKAEATFFEGDSLPAAQNIILEGGVSFLGSGMGVRRLNEKLTRYQYESVGDFPDEFSFSFAGGTDERKRFGLSMQPVDSFFILQPFSKTAGGEVELTNGAPGPEEKLVLLISDSEGKAKSIQLAGPMNGKVLSISPEQLASLRTGAGELYLVKKHFRKIQENNYTAFLNVEYYTRSIPVLIVE